ncbi:MAG TPA: alpha/beta hydrolase [Candidatus Aquilonibacter sp.]|nr:alpha/beta hydrolase [Candidatus Aquilonibacter sp.]
MAFLTVGKENSADIEIYYEDRGSGRPVVLIHGWPLNGGSWERQSAALLAAGYRVITYDRRGFGRSSQPAEGYDYDTLAKDTWHLLEKLDLKDATLVGFSMGGGEVARYMGKYNEGRVTKAVFASSIAPAPRQSGSNPEGVDPAIFEGIKQKIEKDRFVLLEWFVENFFNADVLKDRISKPAIQANFNVAAAASYQATLNCVDAWLEDFRDDIKQIKVPTLVIHGDADRILPIASTGARMPKLISGATLHVVKDGPHGLNWTHAAEFNEALLKFLEGR